MAKTFVTSALLVNTTATGFTFTTATTLGGTPTTGDLVVIQIDKQGQGAITAPGGWNLAATVIGTTPAAVGMSAVYWRQITGTESPTYAWSWASTSCKAVAQQAHDSAGGTWSVDKLVQFLGIDTASSSITAGQYGSTGTLSTADEFAVASLVLNGTPGSTTPGIGDSFTRVQGTNTQGIEGYVVTTTTAARSPGWSWTNNTRRPIAGLLVTFKTATTLTASGAETSASSEAATATRVKVAAGAETSASSQAATATRTTFGVGAEASASSEAATARKTVFATAAETSASSEAASATRVRLGVAAETSPSSESATATRTAVVVGTETSPSNEAATASRTAVVAGAETSASSEHGTATRTAFGVAAETSASSEAATATRVRVATATETSASSEHASATRTVFAVAAETSASNEHADAAGDVSAAGAETSASNEHATAIRVRLAAGAETSASSEHAAGVVTHTAVGHEVSVSTEQAAALRIVVVVGSETSLSSEHGSASLTASAVGAETSASDEHGTAVVHRHFTPETTFVYRRTYGPTDTSAVSTTNRTNHDRTSSTSYAPAAVGSYAATTTTQEHA